MAGRPKPIRKSVAVDPTMVLQQAGVTILPEAPSNVAASVVDAAGSTSMAVDSNANA